MSHLSPEELIDIAEGTRLETSVPHLATCASCREHLVDVREMMSTVDVDVPEPSPLFWDHLSARVSAAVAAESATAPWWLGFGRLSWSLAGIMSVAVVVIAVSLTMTSGPQTTAPVVPGVVAPRAAGDAGAVLSTDDPSLSLLADLTGSLD